MLQTHFGIDVSCLCWCLEDVMCWKWDGGSGSIRIGKKGGSYM
jgi:hypothetical protein